MINPTLTRENWKDYECFHSSKAMADILHVPQPVADIIANHVSRDNARTPMQWEPIKHAGFTNGEPWMIINDDYLKINVATETKDPSSILHFYKQLIRFRHDHPALNSISFHEINQAHRHVLVFYRQCDEEQLLIVLNLSKHKQMIHLEDEVKGIDLLSNYPLRKLERKMTLSPYESHIFKLISE